MKRYNFSRQYHAQKNLVFAQIYGDLRMFTLKALGKFLLKKYASEEAKVTPVISSTLPWVFPKTPHSFKMP